MLVKNTNATTEVVNGLVSSEALLDKTYNFGAKIPPNENGVLYVIKGLFGVYDAGFSETEFFKQDAIYSKNEQRDMWEYVLNLDEFNTQLLNYHLYETKSARFSYYFIKQNCGYRSGELLELVSDVNTTDRIGGWYAPEYVFQQLQSTQNTPNPLIKTVNYLPSEQTQLRQRFVQLAKPLQQAINQFIADEDMAKLQALSPQDRALVTDFLIAHRTYKLSQQNPSKKATLHDEAIKKQLITARFTMPAGNALSRLPVTPKIPPSASNDTAVTTLAMTHHDPKNNNGITTGMEVGLTMFRKDPLTPYTDIDKRFEMISTQLAYTSKTGVSTTPNSQASNSQRRDAKLRLKEFTFLDMQQIENLAQPLAGEPWLSWQLKAGVSDDPIDVTPHRVYGKAGVGLGWQLNNRWLAYGMLNAKLHDNDYHVDAIAEVGMRAKRQNQALELNYQYQQRPHTKPVQLTELTLNHTVSKNNDVRLIGNYTHNPNVESNGSANANGMQLKLAYQHYW